MAEALVTVTRTQGNNRALKEGSVSPSRCALTYVEVPVLPRAFRRMVRDLEFDVCEMAFTTYLCAKAHGTAFTALPVFLVRGFHHGAAVRSRQRIVRLPDDLAGARVGVNRGYTVTTGVWARGILADEYGLEPGTVTWVRFDDEHVAGYQPPPNVVSAEPGQGLLDEVIGGNLSAAVGVTAESPDLAPLIDDPEEAGYRALAARGFYPINHLVVVRDQLLADDPDLATDLFAAFAESKRRYVEELGTGRLEDPTPTDRMYQRVMDITGTDPLPYGIAPNRSMIDQLITYAVDQGILGSRPSIEQLFAPSTWDLVA